MSENLGPTADPRTQKRLAEVEREIDAQAEADLEWLLKQPQFRRWATGLIYSGQYCGVNKSIWESSSKIYLLEGRRSVGIDVLSSFTKFPELYSQFEKDRVEAEISLINRKRMRIISEDADAR